MTLGGKKRVVIKASVFNAILSISVVAIIAELVLLSNCATKLYSQSIQSGKFKDNIEPRLLPH